MIEERKMTIEELGKLIRGKGEVQALSVVSAFAAGYEAAKASAKEKNAPESKPDPETEKAG